MRRSKLGERLFVGANYFVVILFTIFCFLPFYLLVISSLTVELAIVKLMFLSFRRTLHH